MNYNYTEEHYAEMYNNLPEGLKDLVLSGRLAIQVSAIGSRHGLNADQVADLEPAVEDVCLGLILKNQLAENIKTQVGVDDRVANRVAAEVEIEILRPFEPELIIARQQKEDLDKKIASPHPASPNRGGGVQGPAQAIQKEFEPKNLSEHSNVAAIKNFYNSSSNSGAEPQNTNNTNFDWDNFGKKTVDATPPPKGGEISGMSVDEKIDKLTDTINQLVNNRFGGERKDDSLSDQMKELIHRLEIAEQENAENKQLIKKLQTSNPPTPLANIFQPGEKIENKIKIDAPRSVGIEHQNNVADISPHTQNDNISGNVKIQATTQNQIPVNSTSPKPASLNVDIESIIPEKKPEKETNIFSSVVSQDTANTIVETRNKENQTLPNTISSKKILSLDELIKKGDEKNNEANKNTVQIVFPTVNNDRKIDIKNSAQGDTLRQTLLEDIEFLKKKDLGTNKPDENVVPESQPQNTVTPKETPKLSEELIPKTKEDRMRALQDKIKSMNKGVSAGGANSIAATALDPYKI